MSQPHPEESVFVSEFWEDAQFNLDDIENLLVQYDKDPDKTDIVKQLIDRLHSLSSIFRFGSHNIPAKLCETITAVLDRIQKNKIAATEMLLDTIISSIEHLSLFAEKIFTNQFVDEGLINTQRRALEPLTSCHRSRVDQAAADALTAISTVYSKENDSAPRRQMPSKHPIMDITKTKDRDGDLAYFRELIERLEGFYKDWSGRSEFILHLYMAMAMANEANANIDENQLRAAVFMHDFGMAFVPGDLLRRPDKISKDEKSLLHDHTLVGAEMLYRIGGWEEAATIVLQHHERDDAQGYPEGLTSRGICDGAKILSIADTVYAMSHKQSYRSHARPILRVISEINNKGGIQFDRQWVSVFNKVLRSSAGKKLIMPD